MNKLVLATALFLSSVSPLIGATDPAAQQLLISAKQQASLFHDQASPFQIDVDFVVQMKVSTQGHLTLKWQGKDRWWRKIVIDRFEQIDIRSDDRLYTSRNIAFTPIRIIELVSLLQFTENSAGFQVRKQKQRVENGIQISCLKVEQENVKAKPHEVCINPASQEILRDQWQEPPDERREEQYSDYLDFGGHHFPRKLQLVVNGSVVVKAEVQNLTATVFDQALLLPPRGAIERRQCSEMKHAVALKTPEPMYPKSASQNKLMGDTSVAMTILTDGSVSDVRLIGTATRSMDDATVQTLKGWKFKPAMCGSEPVVSDIEVVVSFRLQ